MRRFETNVTDIIFELGYTILYRPQLRLRYDTTPEQLQRILDGIREMLTTHEHVVQEAPRVRFVRFGEDALIIEIFAYIARPIMRSTSSLQRT